MTLRLGPLIMLTGAEIEFNPWNPNKMDGFMYAKAIESIEEFGMVDPVLVREIGRKKYQVVDGEHRAQACIDLGTVIPAHSVGALDDVTAKRLTIALNEIHGQAAPAEMGKLLEGLLESTAMDELLAGLPFTADTVDAFIGAQKIEWPTEPEAPASPSAGASPPERGASPPERWVERTYRLPVSVAGVLDEAINKARVAFGDGNDHSDAECIEVIAAEFMSSP